MPAEELKWLMEDINEQLKRVEEYFTHKQYLVRAEVLLFPGETIYLVWGKLANKWTLFVRYRKENDAVSQVPLVSAPMDTRMRAVDMLDALEAELQRQMTETERFAKSQAEKLTQWVNKRRDD